LALTSLAKFDFRGGEMNRRVFFLTSRLLAGLAGAWLSFTSFAHAQAQKAEAPLDFPGDSLRLQAPVVLPPGAYTGQRGTLVLGVGSNGRTALELSSGVLEDVKLHVRAGAELILKDVLLRRCQVFVEPRAMVAIRDSGFDRCEFDGFDNISGIGPRVELTQCVLAQTSIHKSVNTLGLDLQDCLVYEQKRAQSGLLAKEAAGGITFAQIARRPRIRYTTFTDCELDPGLFYSSSHCTFKNCRVSGDVAPLAGAPPAAGEIVLPLVWSATASQLPVLSGGVRLQPVQEALPGGCSLSHQWQNGTLALASITAPADAKLLASALPAEAVLSANGPLVIATDPNVVVPVKLTQTYVNGLLVTPLPSGKESGQVSKMTLTVLANGAKTEVGFAQSVGESMAASIKEVQKLMSIRHKALPVGRRFEIGFHDKYSGKDGPSAAVACALLMESSLTGQALDPAFAVTGDLNADGGVQPIGGVSAKIRGATNGACSIVAVPMKNAGALGDVIVRDGPAPLFKIMVFGLTSFDEALALASTERTGPLKEAIDEMKLITDVLKRDMRAAPAILKTPQAVARLQSVLTKAPHCLSAKYLIQYAQGRLPTRLTLEGSIEAADADAQGIAHAIDLDFNVAGNSLRPDELGGSVNSLRNLRPLLDPRVWPYVDGMIDYGQAVRNLLVNPPSSNARLRELVAPIESAGSRAQAAKKKLLTDPAIREELGI
jgi:hypothetical protein